MAGDDPVKEGLIAFVTILGSVALLAAAATLCWLLLFHLALKKLPPVQEALGLRKRDKPTLAEKRHEIEALKAHHRVGQQEMHHHHGGGSGTRQVLSPGDLGLRGRR